MPIMETKPAVVAAVVAVALTVAVIATRPSTAIKPRADAVATESVIESPDAESADQLATSKLGILVDGGMVAYLCRAAVDGGDVVLTAFPCVRRPVGSLPTDCLRVVPGDLARDFGEGNRFPASMAVGSGCEFVPCSVWAGDAP